MLAQLDLLAEGVFVVEGNNRAIYGKNREILNF
jgi:hypothetical protein